MFNSVYFHLIFNSSRELVLELEESEKRFGIVKEKTPTKPTKKMQNNNKTTTPKLKNHRQINEKPVRQKTPKPHLTILAKIMSSCLIGQELTCDNRPVNLSSNLALLVKPWDSWEFDGGHLPAQPVAFKMSSCTGFLGCLSQMEMEKSRAGQWVLLLPDTSQGDTWGCAGVAGGCVCVTGLCLSLCSKEYLFLSWVPLSQSQCECVPYSVPPATWCSHNWDNPVALNELHAVLLSWLPHGELPHSASWSFYFLHVILPPFFFFKAEIMYY